MTQAESDRSVTDWMWILISDKNIQQQSSLEPENIRKHQESVRKTSENIRKHQENIQKKHLETFPSADWGKCSKKKTRRCLLVPLTSLILMVSGLPTAGPRAGLGWSATPCWCIYIYCIYVYIYYVYVYYILYIFDYNVYYIYAIIYYIIYNHQI
jgi:hypothetical protein